MLKFLAYLSLFSIGTAQVLTPSAQSSTTPTLFGPNNTESEPAAQPQSKPNQFGSTPFSFGAEIPILHPGDETITFGGLTIPLSDNRLIKARFEKYLNLPPEEIAAAEEYHKVINQIIDTLTPFPGKKINSDKIPEAYTLLLQASAYPGDAEICKTLAQTVYTSLQAKKDNRNIDALDTQLNARHKQIIIDLDWLVKKNAEGDLSADQSEEGGRRNRGGISPQLASNLQRRFHHVVIASRFYNEIWTDGNTKLHVKKNATFSKLFAEQLGFDPTVSAVESLSREAIKDTENGITAFKQMVKQNNLHSASMRLLEAYAVGEYLTPINLLEFETKQKIQNYTRDISLLFDSAQAKDWGRAHELTLKLKESASDFPSSKAESAITANKVSSSLAASQAMQQLISGDATGAGESIRSATEIWPTNPKIGDFQKLLDGAGVIKVAEKDFDRLIREENYREIVKRQYELFPALKDSPEKLSQLQEIVENIKKIEIALEKASSFTKAGNSYAAWEELAIIRERFPDDPKLGRQLELLAPDVADFTKALRDAKNLASREPQQTGSAISHYLKARSIYPSSEFAKQGLDELINQTLGN